MKYIWNRGKILLLASALTFAITSCVDGYDDDHAWKSTVQNQQLTSPEESTIVIAFSADGLTQTISWPVVPGAGGYKLSVYDINDPDNPVTIVEDVVVDGIALKNIPSFDDTKFKLLITTLGNVKMNNTEAPTPTEKSYTNMLPTTAVIPTGTNLTQYFIDNPISADSIVDLCYQLEVGGTYTMTGDINQYLNTLVIRGDKVLTPHPVISISAGSFINDGGGFRLQYLDIDYTSYSEGNKNKALVQMNTTLNPAVVLSGNSSLVVPTSKPIILQSCNIKNMKSRLFDDGAKKYAIGTFLIKDCILGFDASEVNDGVIFCASGMIKDFTMTNSTMYNTRKVAGSNYFLRIHGGSAADILPKTETWGGGSCTLSNSTFFQCAYGGQTYNSNGKCWKQASDKLAVTKCVFVDSYGDGINHTGIIRRIRSSSNTQPFTADCNTYWYDGAFEQEEVDHGNGDKSGTAIDTDPLLVYDNNGGFTMSGATQISKRTGDPRWLPEL